MITLPMSSHMPRHLRHRQAAAGSVPTRPESVRIPTPKPIEAWMEAKTGKPAEEITIADVQALPRQEGLKYAEITSRLGDRLDRHLKHLSDEAAAELLEIGDRFLEETPTALTVPRSA